MSEEHSSGLVGLMSSYVGTTEPALKLLLTVLAGYPVALIYRKYICGKDSSIQHLFFILSGFALGYWNYGRNIFHCVFTIFLNHCVFSALGGTSASVAFAFVFNMGYLFLGYFYNSTEHYDINWTMPQCILTLRLIGIAFDIYDGQQDPDKLSKDNKKVALKNSPGILEIFGHCLFPAAFMVGPQFPMKRYQEFVSGLYGSEKSPDKVPDSERDAVRRFSLGILYLLIFQLVGFIVSDDYIVSDQFGNTSFFKKMMLLGLWGRYTLCKYISCWLLAEGACTLFGVSYNKDPNGEIHWDGVENIKLDVFENTTEFNDYIQSFNVNTNHWIAQYVYKRLKFFGNRHLSQLASLLFLAVWHGFHSGYYVCFFFEFVVIYMERDIKSIVNSHETLTRIFSSQGAQTALHVILRIYTFVLMGWCLLPFAFFTFDKYWRAFSNANYVGIILFLMWPVVYSPIIKFCLKRLKKKTNAE